MTNTPDLTQYRDLRIYDRDVQDIFDAALQDLRMKLPDWEPREDNTEVMLLESMALEVAESIFAINRLPGSIMTILMQMYGITRDEGAYPTATVTVHVVDSFGYTIESGTQFLLSLPGGLDPVVFTATQSMQVPVDSYTVDIPVTGDRFTEDANNLPAGTVLEVLDPIAYIERAVLASTVVDGRTAETDLQWAERGSQRLRRLADTLVTPNHFVAAAMEMPEVSRAHAIDLYNPGSGVPGDSPGHVSVAVYGTGRLLTTGEKTAIRDTFDRTAQANLTVHIVDPTITTVNVTVTVRKFSTYEEFAVRENVIYALSRYLSPETWAWSQTVRVNELISLIDQVEGVDYIVNITNPASNITLPGYAPLVTIGTVTVNIEG